MLLELQPDVMQQQELALEDDDLADWGNLMATLEGLNLRYGRGKSRFFARLFESESAITLAVKFWQSVLALFAIEHESDQPALCAICRNTQL